MCLWFQWSDSSFFSVSFSVSLTGLITSLYFSLGAVQTLFLFVTISFLSLSFVFLALCSLPLSLYNKQAYFFSWFMWLIPLNQLLLQRTNKDFHFSLLQRTNRGFHYCRGFTFRLFDGLEHASPICVYMEVQQRITSLSEPEFWSGNTIWVLGFLFFCFGDKRLVLL